VAEEYPLRDFARGAAQRRGRGQGRWRWRASDFEDTRRGSGRFEGRTLDCRALRLGHRRFLHHYGTNAGEVEAPQEGACPQLAGPANIHQELHDGRAQLAEFAREFIRAWHLLRVALAREQRDAVIGKRIEYVVESLR